MSAKSSARRQRRAERYDGIVEPAQDFDPGAAARRERAEACQGVSLERMRAHAMDFVCLSHSQLPAMAWTAFHLANACGKRGAQ